MSADSDFGGPRSGPVRPGYYKGSGYGDDYGFTSRRPKKKRWPLVLSAVLLAVIAIGVYSAKTYLENDVKSQAEAFFDAVRDGNTQAIGGRSCTGLAPEGSQKLDGLVSWSIDETNILGDTSVVATVMVVQAKERVTLSFGGDGIVGDCVKSVSIEG